MISAMSSGSGKTTVTCALLRAIVKRGIKAEGFKCGPDYIDPMFQRRVLGIPSHNLDIFLQGEENVIRTLDGQTGEIGVIEGAMGFYDGIGGTEDGSAWHISALTDTPVILVIHPSGAGITLAAQVKGIMDFRKPCLIAGIILNNCKKGLFTYLKPIIERECGIPVLGYMPPCDEARLESRHLGLVTAYEVKNFEQQMDLLAEQLEKNCDIDRILSVCRETGKTENKPAAGRKKVCRIAVASDAAFCFYYEENLRALEDAGAALVFFSPLNDEILPECDGLYLGGGYPELYAKQLSENISLREEILRQIQKGMPTVAECGGFLYLQRFLAGKQMVGALKGEGFDTGKLCRFGYVTLTAKDNSMLFCRGEQAPAHEFHYWDCTENGADLTAKKSNGTNWECGICSETMYAAFPHLHFGGNLPLAQRFVNKAVGFREEKWK